MGDEIPAFSIAEKDHLAIIENKFQDPIWGELALLLIKDPANPTTDEKTNVDLINMEINDVLERIIFKNLKKFYVSRQPGVAKLSELIKKLNTIAGEDQLNAIDEAIIGDPNFFWESVEMELIRDCIKSIVNDFKIARAKEHLLSKENKN